MKKLILLLVLFSLLRSYGQTPSNDPHWQILWQDDFDSLNTTIWNKVNNEGHGAEPQIYREQNAYVLNGNLVLEMKNEPYLGYFYTSGEVITKQNYFLHFGYLEARFKLPCDSGFWPAFWTHTGEAPWGYEENDIFEMVPGTREYCHNQHLLHTNYIMSSNVHLEPPCYLCGGVNCDDDPLCNCDDPFSFPSIIYIQDYTQWHTYAIEWSPSSIIWFVDDYPVRYYQNSQIITPTRIILNFALNPSFNNQYGSMPSKMYVDYVKVYTLNNEDCNDFINSTNYDFSTYNNIEKNFIKIGDGSGNNSIPV